MRKQNDRVLVGGGAEWLNDTRLMETFRLQDDRGEGEKKTGKSCFHSVSRRRRATTFFFGTELLLLLKSFFLNESICTYVTPHRQSLLPPLVIFR